MSCLLRKKHQEIFDTYGEAYSYQLRILKHDNVKTATITKLYNIHTSDWQYQVSYELWEESLEESEIINGIQNK